MPVRRPDPAAGVFETLLIADGQPVALERHLMRLERSVATLYGQRLPSALAERIRETAAGSVRGRMRVDFRPAGVTMTVRPVGERTVPLRLVPCTVPGGLGEHKWADRELLDALGADGEPLLCDLDGLVLETARGNLFAVVGRRRLLTPPTDGRILPGVTRARVIELAEQLGLEVHSGPLTLTRVREADELFVTGAIGGVEPACLKDGPSPAADTAERLAHALGRRALTSVGSV